MTDPAAGVPTPDAAVVPALASTFNSEFTSLGRVIARPAWVCTAFRTATLSQRSCRSSTGRAMPLGIVASPNFPIRKQKLRVSLPHGLSPFGTVFSESHWQALSVVFD